VSRTLRAAVGGLALLLLGAGAAAAEEPRPAGPLAGVPLLLELLRPGPESPQAALAGAIREDAARPAERPAWQGEVQPDGSVRYGRGPGSVTVLVRNPCPDGAYHDPLPRPLPGRTRR
jgi:hypothetical protein